MSRAFRYNLILALVGLGTSLAAVAGWRFAKASAPVNGPIVLVTVDSLRADRLGAYGNSTTPTPAFDALAADGVVFERAYAHVPQTLPAHVSLLSGRLPADTGVRDDVGFAIPESLRLVSAMLADRGYATGGVVSSFALRKDTGLARGFGFFDDELPPSDTAAPASGPVVERDGAESEVRAERWLSAAGTSRAFLFLHLNEPHAPYTPPASVGVGGYDGEVAYADEIVGRLIAYLKKQQLYDESTIIVVGDHGESLGGHGEQEHGLLVFDDTIRVPLIIKQAGSVGGGRRVADLAQHVDIVPTILDFAKAPAPNGLAGRSLRPLLEGRPLAPRVAYAESFFPELQYGWPAPRTVTDGRFRLVSGPVPALFDLEADPDGRVDVSAAYPEALAQLTRALDAFANAAEPPRAQALSVSAADRERFLALGFLGPRALAPAGPIAESASLADNPGAFVASYRAAMIAVAHRRWTPAIDQLRALARAHSSRADLWMALGAVAEQGDRLDVASEAYRRVLVLVPDALDARAHLAATLLRAKRYDESRDHAQHLTESDDVPAHVRGLELLARIAAARHDSAGARVQTQRLLALDPTSPLPAYIEGQLLFDRGHFEDALTSLETATTLARETPVSDLHLLRGQALVALDRQAEGEDALLAELRDFPANAHAFAALATLYHAQGRAEDVTATLTALTRLGTHESFDQAARLWTSFGQRERAAAVRTEAQRQFASAVPAPLTQQ